VSCCESVRSRARGLDEEGPALSDHDQRFKNLFREFFAEFFALFFPAWASRFDFTRVDWLEQEVFTDPPQGQRRSLDLVARLPVRPDAPPPAPHLELPDRWIALVHVEIEAQDRAAPLRPRMHAYYEQLRRRHGLPVLPIAMFLRVGLDGIGWDTYQESFWDHEVLSFSYAYVGLPALDGEHYLAGENLLGVALTALMRVPPEKRAAVGAEALRRVVEARENDYRRYLLWECIEAYTTLDQAQRRQFEDLLQTERYQEVRAMNVTTFEKGHQQGLQQGLQQGENQGQRKLLRSMLEDSFGPLSAQAQQRLEALTPEQFPTLARALRKAQSLQELGLED
jgi:hypothetical protein